jgi:hypothetical protein
MELLLNRSNNDIEILKRAYTKKYGLSLETEVKDDLSSGTQICKFFHFSAGGIVIYESLPFFCFSSPLIPVAKMNFMNP